MSMYNSSCWAAPMSALDKLDKAHRRHLRSILNYSIGTPTSSVMTTCISAAILNLCQREWPVVGGECLVMYCVDPQMVQPIPRSDLLLTPYSYKGGVEDRSQTYFH